MNFERYTDRAKGFIQAAQALALRENNQQVTPSHLLKVLLDDPEGLASGRQILARMLRNLKGIYRETDKPERMLPVLNRMLALSPDASAELRDRGFLYQRLECFRAAHQDLTAYLEREPDAPDLDEVRASLMDLTVRCARLN